MMFELVGQDFCNPHENIDLKKSAVSCPDKISMF
jgi:hypothetical protein